MKHILAALALGALAAPAAAQTAVGLAGDRTLVTIDPATAMATGTVDVQIDGMLLGIDWRPATGQLIGVTAAHAIVEIDAATGAVTEISTMPTMLPLMDGQQVVVDFNPAADRLRFMTGTTNHRVNVDTGEVTVDGMLAYGDDASMMPMIAAAAYINSYGKPESTTMYDIDAAAGTLVRQAPPNDGVLAAVGPLGVAIDGPVAFDVATSADGMNTAWLVAGGMLHTVDLETGAVSQSWQITGTDMDLRDLTVIPAM
jgi:hypothetical protein